MAGALHGVKVVDLSQVIAGPLCTLLLGDFGADVIKIEPPDGDSSRQLGSTRLGGDSDYYLAANRNKRSVVLDLKTPRGLAMVKALIRGADVVVENFRPGVMERLGLSYETLLADNPGLIYCSINGFGHDGPHRDKPALDPVVQAMSGVMQLTGTPDSGPLKTGILLSDFVTPLFGTMGVLAALYARNASGKGQRIDVSMLDATIFAMLPRDGHFFATGETPARMANAHYAIVPYNTFRTSDDRHIMVIAHDDKFWRALTKGLGLDALVDDARFRGGPERAANRQALEALMTDAFVGATLDHWEGRLTASGALFAPVRDFEQVFGDPGVKAGMVATVAHPTAGEVRLLKSPVRFSVTPADIRRAPPLLGEHTDAVVAALDGAAAGARSGASSPWTDR